MYAELINFYATTSPAVQLQLQDVEQNKEEQSATFEKEQSTVGTTPALVMCSLLSTNEVPQGYN